MFLFQADAPWLCRDVMKYTLQFVPQDMPLYDMLNQFQTGKSMPLIVHP